MLPTHQPTQRPSARPDPDPEEFPKESCLGASPTPRGHRSRSTAKLLHTKLPRALPSPLPRCSLGGHHTWAAAPWSRPCLQGDPAGGESRPWRQLQLHGSPAEGGGTVAGPGPLLFCRPWRAGLLSFLEPFWGYGATFKFTLRGL